MRLFLKTSAYLLAVMGLAGAILVGAWALLSDPTGSGQAVAAQTARTSQIPAPAASVAPSRAAAAFPIGPAVVHVMPNGPLLGIAEQAKRRAKQLSASDDLDEQPRVGRSKRKARAVARRRIPESSLALGYADVPAPAFDQAVGR